MQLHWQQDEAVAEAVRCNGCGQCRTETPALRMCPIFRATHEEAATPRAKANLMRQLLQPDVDPARLASDEVRAVADLCVNCKMCAVECPAQVNIPRLMLWRPRPPNTVQHGLDRTDWAMALALGASSPDSASAFALLTNELSFPAARRVGCWKSWSACQVGAGFPLSPRRELPYAMP